MIIRTIKKRVLDLPWWTCWTSVTCASCYSCVGDHITQDTSVYALSLKGAFTQGASVCAVTHYIYACLDWATEQDDQTNHQFHRERVSLLVLSARKLIQAAYLPIRDVYDWLNIKEPINYFLSAPPGIWQSESADNGPLATHWPTGDPQPASANKNGLDLCSFIC